MSMSSTSSSDRFIDCQVPASGRIVDAMRALERGNLQIVFVVDDAGAVLGTATDGDLRRALLAGASLDSSVSPYISRDFVRVGPGAGRAEVLDLMQAQAVGQVPVLDDRDHLVGVHLMREMLGQQERPNWAVIMAGGKGVRLRPITEHIPKSMLPVAGRPILERLVLHLVGHGFRRIFLAVNYLSEIIEHHFGDGSSLGCQIEYLRETKPLGTGGALTLLPEPPRAPLLVLNGDLVVQVDVDNLLAFHEAGRYRMTVAVHEYTHTVPFGVLDLEGARVTSITEKPTMSWRTNAGIYVLEPSLLRWVPPDVEFPLPAIAEGCLSRGEPVGAFHLQGDWIDVGRATELRRARGDVETG
jgi:dTDP-glucose pyrophosphorylase